MARKFGRIGHLKRDREIEGVTGVDLKIDGNIFLTVRAATDANAAWREKAPRVLREIRRLNNAGAPDAQVRAKLAALYADVIVIGWRGVVDEADEAVPFTREACLDFLMEADDAMKAIDDHCYDSQNFRAAKADEAIEQAGN
jgi:hypothetical protein